MSSVTIYKDDTGKLAGFGASGARAYNKFLKAVRSLDVGEMLTFSFKVPRAPSFHRFYFVTLQALFDAQEQFADFDEFRKWLQVGAGHVRFVPGPSGRMVALPKSIAYDALEQDKFEELYEKVKEFMRTEHARQFLWGHLSSEQSAQTVDAVLSEFEHT